jgi:hypothetical protein
VFLIEVTDGREVYVLEALRSDVGAPVSYTHLTLPTKA